MGFLIFAIPNSASAANRYWVGADTGATSTWNSASNWSTTSGGAGGAGVPTSSDDVIFDGGGSKVGGVVIDTAVSVASITATSAYTGAGANDGHIDNATNNQSITVSGDVTLDNKQVSVGDTTMTVSGSFDFRDVATFNRNTSTIVMNGTGTAIVGTSLSSLNNLTISSYVTISADTNSYLVVQGVLDVSTASGVLILEDKLRMYGVSGDLKVTHALARITGDNTILIDDNAGLSQMDGTIDVSILSISRGHNQNIAAAQYDATTVTISANATETFTSNAGTYIFTGNVSFINTAAVTFTINNTTASPDTNWEFRGNVSFENTGGGTLVWTKGTGSILLSGSTAQEVNFLGKSVEDITVNKSSGLLTMTGAVVTDSFTVTQGEIDINSQAITTSGNFTIGSGGNIFASGLSGSVLTVGGDFSANGSSGDLLSLNASGAWILNVSGAGSATYASVAYSDASGGSPITGGTGILNLGNNKNWTLTSDSTSPTINSISPIDGEVDVSLTENLVIIFSEAVIPESGANNDIIIKKTSDNSTVETIDVQSGLVTGSGTTTITINPSSDLLSATSYYIQVGADAFDDSSGNDFAGISDTTTWNFTTIDSEAPILSSTTPADNSTGSTLNANFILNFTENISKTGTGAIQLRTSTGGLLVENITTTGSKVTGSGTSTITINPSTTLNSNTEYYITIDNMAFYDDAGNNFAGISDATTWNFTTSNLSHTLSSTTINGSLDVEVISGGEVSTNVYYSGSVLRLYAHANEGYSFSGFTGDLSGSLNMQTITLNTDMSVTATFGAIQGTYVSINSAWLATTGSGATPYYLDQDDTTYTLHTNVSGSGTAFAIIADDVTFDLNGYTITYDNATPINLGVNGDFEIGSGSPVSGWSFASAADADVAAGTFVQPVTVSSGSQALRFSAPASDQYIRSSQQVTLAPNTTYAISAMFYNMTDSAITLYAELEGTSVMAYDEGLSTRGFGYRSDTITTGSSAETYYVRVGMSGATVASSGYVYIDDVRIQRIRQHGVLVGPKSFADIYHPDITRIGYADSPIVKNGKINQGADAGDESNGIYARGSVNSATYSNLIISVFGANAKAIYLSDASDVSINNNELLSSVTVIRSRDALHGIINADDMPGGEIYNNTITGGPHCGIVATGDISASAQNLRIHDNTISLQSRYTNGYGIFLANDSGSYIYNNTINAGSPDDEYSGHGISIYGEAVGGNAKIYNNTITARVLSNNQEYNGFEYDGSFGIQIRDGNVNLLNDIEIYDNTITAYAEGGLARALRIRGEFASGLHIHDNALSAIKLSGSENATVFRFTEIETATGEVLVENNTISTNSEWFAGYLVNSLQFRSNTFEQLSNPSSPFLPFSLLSSNAGYSIHDIRFVDNSYTDISTEQAFEGASIVLAGGSTTPEEHSSFNYDWTLTYTVESNDGTELSGATVTITDSGSNVTHTGTTNSNGTGSAMLSEFRNSSGSLTQYNPYLVTATYNGQTATGSITMDATKSITLTMGESTASNTTTHGAGGRVARQRNQGSGSSGGSGDGSVATNTESAFTPSYAGLATGGIRSEYIQNLSEEEQAVRRRTIAAQEAIFSYFQSQLAAESSASSGFPHTAAGTEEVGRTARIAEQRGLLMAQVNSVDVIYRDVPIDAWYSPYIAMLIDDGIAEGYRDLEGEPTGEFGVANPVTTAEVLKMTLVSADEDLTGLPPSRNTSAKGTWASSYVAKAEALAIPGISPDLDVHTPATRADVIRIILHILNFPVAQKEASFTDVSKYHPAASAIATAEIYGFIKGDTDVNGNPLNTFRPDDFINRAEVSKILVLIRKVLQ
ncbi:MAG: Ig-like domain-containing protein [Kiritimatiellales bacterium]|nr:Ig-like domain-containing protein [Kiritimatiellales bacterium]